MKVEVGREDSFGEGKPHAVRAGDRDLVLVRRNGEFFAVRDACPHQGARLSAGYLTGDVGPCEPGDQPELVREGEFLACPWHGWKVDIRTGCSPLEPDRVRVRNYAVTVEDGKVWVETEGR